MNTSSKPRNRSLLAVTLLVGALGGSSILSACTQREVAAVDPRQNREQAKEIPVSINRDIDILFVIDDSGSMRDEQESLAANFSNFINVLNNIEGGLPNVHIGVVSTNVGTGPNVIDNCNGNGDDGVLLVDNGPAGCSKPTDRYISDVADQNGDRQRNYSGTLTETFSCIAQLGINGCGFEQPLESMRRALNDKPENAGFLREDAFLAIVIVSDEDDCSVKDAGMFDTSPAQDTIDSDLGFLSSFRCFEFGVQCEPDSPRTIGPRQDCQARTDSQYMTDVLDYVNFLKGLKDDPNSIIVAGIIGDVSPVSVGTNDSGEPTLEASCSSSSGEADPGLRLKTFLDSFPNRSTTTTICNDDLSDALTVIASLLAEVIGTPCIDGDLALDDNGQPECTVADVTNLNQDGQTESIIPSCAASPGAVPCYSFEVDNTQCGDTPTQLALLVERGATEPEKNTTLVARCVAN